jgi:oligoribonuclease (3'-5' exoribonuclease)
MNPQHLLWIDLETTQTDPRHPYAAILEVGAIITRWDVELTEVARANLVLRPPGNMTDHDQLWAHMEPVVQEMHHTNGLWQEATSPASGSAWGLTEADDGLAAWVVDETGGDELIPLAGSGVGHLDLPFVKAFMPRLAGRITYWPIDIGNVRRSLQLAGRDDLVNLAGDVDAKPHRGLGDVEMHVAEARRYLGLLGRIPVGDPVATGS